ncbi:lipopolysaccharide heptosyltransferase family protein, partial [Pelagibacteraceae bacterium]|nr:lipopolysaccharide heptosyltransferase family protein [Pelagibacteraceae bacterium]
MKRILLYNSGGGLGDSIQLFTLILSLQKYYKNSKFFYLGAHENHFEGRLKEFGIKVATLELGIKYFGFRWRHLFIAKKKFLEQNFSTLDLIIDLQSKL